MPLTKSIVLIGLASSGKTTVGRLVAKNVEAPFIDLDDRIEEVYESIHNERMSCRDIFREHGEASFRMLETRALESLVDSDPVVLATGGGTPLISYNQGHLKQLGTVVYLSVTAATALQRMTKPGSKGIPAWLESNPTVEGLDRILRIREAEYFATAAVVIETDNKSEEEVAVLVTAEASFE